jgi:hypothetical protein
MSPALVISVFALVLAAGGTSFAESPVALVAKTLGLNSKQKKQVKSIADKEIGAKASALTVLSATNATNATHATSANTAGSATNATNATTATNATNATNATTASNATNAAALGGKAPSAYALVAQPEFIAATLGAGFTNIGIGYSEAGYMRDTLGFVHLRGTMSCPVGEKTAFTLPTGYRPAVNVFFPLAVGTTGAGNVQVFSNGEIKTFLPKEALPCGLDSLVFKAEQ